MRLLRGKPPNTPILSRKEEDSLRKRPIKISVRLNEQEHEYLKRQSEFSGLPMEPFIRSLIMGCTLKPRPPEIYRELLREIAAIGNNVNQLARAANAKGYANQEDIRKMLENQIELWLKIKDF